MIVAREESQHLYIESAKFWNRMNEVLSESLWTVSCQTYDL